MRAAIDPGPSYVRVGVGERLSVIIIIGVVAGTWGSAASERSNRGERSPVPVMRDVYASADKHELDAVHLVRTKEAGLI